MLKALSAIIFILSCVLCNSVSAESSYYLDHLLDIKNGTPVEQEQNQPGQHRERQRPEPTTVSIPWCVHEYNISKAQYLSAKEQMNILKRRQERLVGKALVASIISLVARHNTDNQFNRDIFSGVAIAGGVIALMAEGERNYYRRSANEILPPVVPEACKGEWDMQTFNDPNRGVLCHWEEFYGFDQSYKTIKLKTYVCSSSSYEKEAVYNYYSDRNIFRKSDIQTCGRCD